MKRSRRNSRVDDLTSHFNKKKRINIIPKGRIFVTMGLFSCLFIVIGARLSTLAMVDEAHKVQTASVTKKEDRRRPNLVDRNGKLLATDILMPTLVADPSKLFDVDDTIERLIKVLPSLDEEILRKELSNKKSEYARLKRGLTPKQAKRVHELGIPGFAFRNERRRVYPGGRTAAHILGHVNHAYQGQSGMEAYLDKIEGLYISKLTKKDERSQLELSIDLGAQYALRSKIVSAIAKYKAKAGGGILLDINTGEVLAMASLPDFDPNLKEDILKKDRFNRLTIGTFELGSIFKTFTTAMALEIGGAKLDDLFDATEPIKEAGFTIKDYHGQKRPLTVPETFIHSSNIASAKQTDLVEPQQHKEFLARFGLFSPLKTELGNVASTKAPNKWRKIRSMTISYGHGISVSPLKFAASAAQLFNGGRELPVTFLKQPKRATLKLVAEPSLSPKTTKIMRDLMRQNVVEGTGKAAEVDGLRVGGKTGTAEKPEGGRYREDKLLNSFLAIFPSDKPEYLLLVFIDEPQPQTDKPLVRPTGGNTAAPLAGEIISAVGTLLGAHKPEPVPSN